MKSTSHRCKWPAHRIQVVKKFVDGSSPFDQFHRVEPSKCKHWLCWLRLFLQDKKRCRYVYALHTILVDFFTFVERRSVKGVYEAVKRIETEHLVRSPELHFFDWLQSDSAARVLQVDLGRGRRSLGHAHGKHLFVSILREDESEERNQNFFKKGSEWSLPFFPFCFFPFSSFFFFHFLPSPVRFDYPSLVNVVVPSFLQDHFENSTFAIRYRENQVRIRSGKDEAVLVVKAL